MGSIGWVAVGVAAWGVVSVPAALLLGVLLRVGAGRPAPRRTARRTLRAAPCSAPRVPAARVLDAGGPAGQ